MGDNLPSHVIINFLSRLPTESLSECSVVCKTWRHLIYNDRSLAHTLSRRIFNQDSVDAVSSGKATFLYLSNSYYSINGHTLLKHMEYDDDDHEKPLKFGTTNLVPAPEHKPCRIIGSCNGLICISVLSEKDNSIEDPICICNPVTRESVYLPKLTKKFRPGDYVVSGLGYHPSTNEYKVVRIYFRAASKEKPFVGRVQVYTLGSGQGWRTLENITYNLHPSISCEILANGALHWLDENGKIVKFDLSDETFIVLPTPKYVDHMWDFHRKHVEYSNIFREFELRVLGGCLRIIRRDSRWYDIFSFKKRKNLSKKKEKERKKKEKERKSPLPENGTNGKQDIEKERYKSSWSWATDTFNWGSLDYDQWTSAVYPFAILKDNAKILYHDNQCNCYRQDLAGYKYEIIGEGRVPNPSVRYVKSFISLKALGEEAAKIMESSEPSFDLDSDNE